MGDEGFETAMTLLVENTESPHRPFFSVVSAKPVTAEVRTWRVSVMLDCAGKRMAVAGEEFAVVDMMHCWTHKGRM